MKTTLPNQTQAEEIAVAALGFVASDEILLGRFVDITGIKADQIRKAARQPGFLAGVLQFVLAHEPTLMDMSAATGYTPDAISHAQLLLGGGDSYMIMP